MENLFFNDWESLLRALITTIMAYITLVVFIRVSGKRTLAKMNAFDFTVTIALGSCLAAVSLNKSIALAEGALVFLTFISLQFLITWTSVRIKAFKKIVAGEPVMLYYQGHLLTDVMKKERITKEEIFVSARASGILNLEDVAFAVLETTGDITIIKKTELSQGENTTLQNVINPDAHSVGK